MLLFSCAKDKGMEGTYDSDAVNYVNGKTRSFVKLNEAGEPQQLGITLTDASWYNLPVQDVMQSIPLNDQVRATTLFQYISVRWNAHGHTPAGIYDVPHFDFHFHMISEEEVMNITDPVLLYTNPDAAYLPEHYMAGPAETMMGRHWVDSTSGEFTGHPFTQTFVYGSYNGNVTFYEPMITLAFLQNTTSFERQIPQPQKFKKTGWYPTIMRISRHDGLTDIILDGFVKREGS